MEKFIEYEKEQRMLIQEYLDLISLGKTDKLTDEQMERVKELDIKIKEYLKPTSSLTTKKREQVKDDLLSGKDVIDIAKDLELSINTVKTIRKDLIKRKILVIKD